MTQNDLLEPLRITPYERTRMERKEGKDGERIYNLAYESEFQEYKKAIMDCLKKKQDD